MFCCSWTPILSVGLLLILQTSKCFGTSSIEKFLASSCGELFSTADSIDRGLIQSLLPTSNFWDFFKNEATSVKNDILLVDVDVHSWQLLVNQVIALRKSGSGLAHNVYAIAYDNSTCGHLTSMGIGCYYSLSWNEQLANIYRSQTRHIANTLHVIMLGRMITTTVALCEGHSVFLSDTDVVFYRDPIQYAFKEADIMITATQLRPDITDWGHTYFTDLPGQSYTLNNGVVFYRSSAVSKSFALTLVAHSVNRLNRRHDPERGFLQKVFNGMMVHNKLALHSCRKNSDFNTFRLNTTSSHITNTVGECYDCYFGHFPWYSDVVRNPAASGHHHPVLKIGVFPLTRYTSFCWAPPGKHTL